MAWLFRAGSGSDVARRMALPDISRVNNIGTALVFGVLLGLTAPSALGAEPEWLTDYKKAQQQAKEGHKLLLVDFTGSDWCPPCKLLQREVFSKREFQDYASKNVVLLEIDFPRAKEQSPTVREQNERLAQEYQIQGFPTIVVLDGDGRKVWRHNGYFPDGPEAFIAELEKLRKG